MGHHLTSVTVAGAELYSCVTVREPAWHTLGVNFADRSGLTVDEALTEAHQNFTVRTVPLTTTPDDPAGQLEVPGLLATVREHPVTGDTSVLGWVSPRYRVVQNREAYDFAQALVDDHGANIVSAGGLYGDRRTFVTLQLPDPIRISDDPHIPYLVLTNSHDGSTALTTAITPVRVVCQNTARAALSQARHKWSARHTAGVTSRIAEARRTLHLAHTYTAAFRDLGEQLIAQRFTPAQFDTMTNVLLPTEPDATDRQTKALADTRTALHGLFTTAATQDSIRGTRWAAYNAITEFADWGPLRGADPNHLRRSTRILTEQQSPLKLRAIDYLLAA